MYLFFKWGWTYGFGWGEIHFSALWRGGPWDRLFWAQMALPALALETISEWALKSLVHKLKMYLFFYMGLDVWIWMGGKSFSRPIWRGGPWDRLFWAQMALAALAAISGPKKVSTFRAQPFKRPSLWISPHPNPYVPPHISNRYIKSQYIMERCISVL